MTQQATVLPIFDIQEVERLYSQSKFECLSSKFIEVLDFFSQNTAFSITAEEFNYINQFVYVFLHVFSDDRFQVSKKNKYTYVGFNNVVSNLVSITAYKNTDVFLERISDHKRNLCKVLTLYSARNVLKFDESIFFEADSELASYWYGVFARCFYSGLIDKHVAKSLMRHYLVDHPKLEYNSDIQVLSFGSTYLDGKIDRVVKGKINQYIQSRIKSSIKNFPSLNKIGVFSLNWRKNHSVYRNYWAYLGLLRSKYELTFFKLEEDVDCDTELFHKVLIFKSFNELLGSKSLLDNNFAAFYFPDVGMNAESIILSNYRIAPVQICSPGHSVSTFGSKIDYFISGKDVEVEENPRKNYSEKLVLIPGMGVIHNKPNYQLKGFKNKVDYVVVNCSWHAQKINSEFISVLNEIISNIKVKFKFRIFLGDSTSKENDHMAFLRAIIQVIDGRYIELYAGLNYEEYMSLMEEGDLAIDCFHFGGCNTVSDSLFLGIPIITWEGDRWYSRIGSQMLKLIGLNECVAVSKEGFVSKVTSNINSEENRERLRRLISEADLGGTIYSTADAAYFSKAVDLLLKGQKAIDIYEDSGLIEIYR